MPKHEHPRCERFHRWLNGNILPPVRIPPEQFIDTAIKSGCDIKIIPIVARRPQPHLGSPIVLSLYGWESTDISGIFGTPDLPLPRITLESEAPNGRKFASDMLLKSDDTSNSDDELVDRTVLTAMELQRRIRALPNGGNIHIQLINLVTDKPYDPEYHANLQARQDEGKLSPFTVPNNLFTPPSTPITLLSTPSVI